mgnify:CR=1 FL=1
MEGKKIGNPESAQFQTAEPVSWECSFRVRFLPFELDIASTLFDLSLYTYLLMMTGAEKDKRYERSRFFLYVLVCITYYKKFTRCKVI